ncbi:uncharacterized protein LOC129573616 [Sitodiplosis mosellana]|uniref:uncharacterized protein LOC129573616 n=1 Tax=Sitodiplosis mosellana TaxID=263140 RepID=UPI002444DA94|nr:uncharacterized protein LOC129573616 [Sitodiplosis mosellana]
MTTLNVVRCGALSSLATAFHHSWFRFELKSPTIKPITCGLVHCKSTNIDVLDIFTTQHILSKKNPTASKSPSIVSSATENNRLQHLKKMALETQMTTKSEKTSLNIEAWTQDEIDNCLIVSINCSDRKTFDEIVQQILATKQLPSESMILRVLCHLCDDSKNSMETITNLIDVCQEKNLAFYAKNMEFAPFLSQYLWKLERFDDALYTLNTIFSTTNQNAKSLILRNYRQIIYDAVKNHDEPILDKVITNTIKVYEKYKDPILITYVWSDCFFSELFRCHQRAEEIFSAHEVIRMTVSKDIGWIALTLLQQHNIDAIHRLIEQCLAAKMIREVGVCLTALFDYHYWRDDLRACSEVMITSLRLGTPVSNTQNQKLLNLLLKKKPKPSNKTPVSKVTGSRFEFKF